MALSNLETGSPAKASSRILEHVTDIANMYSILLRSPDYNKDMSAANLILSDTIIELKKEIDYRRIKQRTVHKHYLALGELYRARNDDKKAELCDKRAIEAALSASVTRKRWLERAMKLMPKVYHLDKQIGELLGAAHAILADMSDAYNTLVDKQLHSARYTASSSSFYGKIAEYAEECDSMMLNIESAMPLLRVSENRLPSAKA